MASFNSAELFEAIVISAFKNKSLHTEHAHGMAAICEMPYPESSRMAAIKNFFIYLMNLHNAPALDIALLLLNIQKHAILMPEP